MLDWLYIALGKMLGFFSFNGSYAIGLLFYALIFKIVFVFFAIKQQKNQIKMAKLTPKIELIRAKYRGRTDQATMRKQQEEIMKLQQDEGYSPLAGCLPLLIQMPIIIFLYNVIRKPLSYIARLGDDVIATFAKHLGETEEIALAGKMKNLTDASVKTSINLELPSGVNVDSIVDSLPDFNLFGLDLAQTPTFNPIGWLVIIPFLVAGFQWLSMFITRKVSGNNMQAVSQDQQSQMSMKLMDLIMPLMTLFFAFKLPAVMGVYWIYQSVFGMVQSVILAKAMPVPKFTEEELKTIQKARRQQEKAQKEIIKTQPKYKSLHYIDDDDYEELPDVKNNSNGKNSNKLSASDKPEIKD